MAVGLKGLPALHSIKGVRWGVAAAGIKTANRNDVALLEICEGASVAAVYTLNAFCAAPVVVAKRHGAITTPRYLLINSGNANAGTGKPGILIAEQSCAAVAEEMDCTSEEVLPFSTGVISEPLSIEKIRAALPQLSGTLNEDGWVDAAHAIMTTDTIAKGCSRQIEINGETITVTGICKGSGMICPDMATMLAYVATDAKVEAVLLQSILQQASDQSFNCITVDGDTSTNDACVLVASGQRGGLITADSEAATLLQKAVTDVCLQLAQAVIRDGEGATKFITVDVQGGVSLSECRQVAYTVAHSPLVKTAFFASDPNWGRILAAVGRAGVENLDVEKVSIFLGDVCIARNGGRDEDYTEAAGQAVMDQEEITITIRLGRGDVAVQVWTTDLSYDYVKINAEYRT